METLWREKYRPWNAANLEMRGVLQMDDWVWVHNSHPVVHLVLENRDETGFDPGELQISDGLYRMRQAPFTNACARLRQMIKGQWVIRSESGAIAVSNPDRLVKLAASFSLTRAPGGHECDAIALITELNRKVFDWLEEAYRYDVGAGGIASARS